MVTHSGNSPAAPPDQMACPMCGQSFDPRENVACGSCPLNVGCALACCPSCGFSNADPAQSWLVRAFEKLTSR